MDSEGFIAEIRKDDVYGKLDLPWSFLHWLVRRMQHPTQSEHRCQQVSQVSHQSVRTCRRADACVHAWWVPITHTHTACMPAVSFEAIQRLVVLRELAEMHDMRWMFGYTDSCNVPKELKKIAGACMHGWEAGGCLGQAGLLIGCCSSQGRRNQSAVLVLLRCRCCQSWRCQRHCHAWKITLC